MIIQFNRVLFALILCTSMPAWAHGHHGHHHHRHHGHEHQEIKLEEIPADGLTGQQLAQLMEEAHHSIEVESEGNFVQRWRDKFRFKQNFLNAYRWYQMHRGLPHVDNAAANITAMFLTSHALETVGGLALAGAGVSNGLDGIMDVVFTTVGVTITIPGLDPLCILLVGAYHKWPQAMDRALTLPRMFVVKGSQLAKRAAGIPEGAILAAIEKMGKDRFLKAFSQNSEQFKVRSIMLRDLEFSILVPNGDETESITLKMVKESDGRQALESVSFSAGLRAIDASILSNLVKPFGRNIREVLLEIHKHIGEGEFKELKHRAYVRAVDELPWRFTVKVKSGAFPFFALEESEFGCESWLR